MFLLFGLAQKILLKVQQKSFRLMVLAEEISRQPSIIDCVMWSLVAILMQIYNKKNQAVQEKKF